MIPVITACLFICQLLASVHGVTKSEIDVWGIHPTYVVLAQSCGGPGRLIQWRNDDCHGATAPCVVTDNEYSVSTIQYVPSANITQLGLRAVFTFEGRESQQIYEGPIEDSKVEGGVLQDIHVAGRLSNEGQQGKFNLQYIFYNVETGVSDLCAEAQFELKANNVCKSQQPSLPGKLTLLRKISAVNFI